MQMFFKQPPPGVRGAEPDSLWLDGPPARLGSPGVSPARSPARSPGRSTSPKQRRRRSGNGISAHDTDASCGECDPDPDAAGCAAPVPIPRVRSTGSIGAKSVASTGSSSAGLADSDTEHAPARRKLQQQQQQQLGSQERKSGVASQRQAAGQALLGVWLALDGALTVLTSQRTRKHLLVVLAILLAYSAASYALVQMVFLPMTLVRITASHLGHSVHTALDSAASFVEDCVRWWILASPDIGLYFVRYLYPDPLDTLFFDTLRDITVSHNIPDPRKARFALRFSQANLDARDDPRYYPNAPVDAAELDGIPVARRVRAAVKAAAEAAAAALSETIAAAARPITSASAHGHTRTHTQAQDRDPAAQYDSDQSDHGEHLHQQAAALGRDSSIPDRIARRLERLRGMGIVPRQGISVRMMRYLSRYMRRLAFVLVVSLLSKLPLVGWLCWPAASFAFFRGIVGWRIAAGMFAFGVISPPWWRFMRGRLLRGTFAFRALGRELLEPYLCRSLMTSKEMQAWMHENQLVVYGFTAVFYPLISLPWVGPLFFGIAQGAAARLSLELFDVHDYKGR
ncbi:hypothetical protein HK105_200632 [Polyrhizophydium stewartii]|uniref:Autophagy-related protein 9 n=1 Tax=Polyrhizophydium stewartii TaxID=2732419 RepID=A0ABR4NJK0_9FUNG